MNGKEGYLKEFYKSIEIESYGLEKEVFESSEKMFNKIILQKLIKYFHSIKGITKFINMELFYKIACESEKILKKIYEEKVIEESFIFEIISETGIYFRQMRAGKDNLLSLKKGSMLLLVLSYLNENNLEKITGKCLMGADTKGKLYYSGVMGEFIFDGTREEIEKKSCIKLFGKNIDDISEKEVVTICREESEKIKVEIEILKKNEDMILFCIKIVSKEIEEKDIKWKSKNSEMKKAYEMARLASKNSSTILITGETGTGKEVIADKICRLSGISEDKIVKINCGALSQTLLESELFGYEKGAFTGAVSAKKGYFEMADNGIIFLDEIGEVDKNIQVKLLRVIQEGEFFRLGGTKQKKVNVKIIAATNKDLKVEVEKGNIREDLYYRLNVYNINIPPLRDRKEDLDYLLNMFIEEFNKETGKMITGITEEAREKLMKYEYKGNIRELKNIMEYVFINGAERVIEYEDLPQYLRKAINKSKHTDGENIKTELNEKILTLDEIEREHVKKVLQIFNGNKMRSARVLDIDVRRLTRLIEKHNIH